jgi:hypothetical protein
VIAGNGLPQQPLTPRARHRESVFARVDGTSAACDPEMPTFLRDWVGGQQWTVTPWSATPRGHNYARRGARRVVLLGSLLTIGFFCISFISPKINAWVAVWWGAAIAAAITTKMVSDMFHRRDERLCRGQFIFPASLDDRSRSLLERAQGAIRSILASDAHKAGLLEHPIEEGTLRLHEWEIASRLLEITKGRSQLERDTPANPAGPLTAEVLNAQRRYIALAEEPVAARVSGLEDYDQRIRAADDADRDWRQALQASKSNDQYRTLLAGTAADEYAIREITELRARIAAAAQARKDRLREADLAAEVLALPFTEPRQEG